MTPMHLRNAPRWKTPLLLLLVVWALLAGLGLRLKQWRPVLRLTGWLALMVVLGLALGAAQLVPLYELVTQSFREGSASLQQVRNWAWPSRQIITFFLPEYWLHPYGPVTKNLPVLALIALLWALEPPPPRREARR